MGRRPQPWGKATICAPAWTALATYRSISSTYSAKVRYRRTSTWAAPTRTPSREQAARFWDRSLFFLATMCSTRRGENFKEIAKDDNFSLTGSTTITSPNRMRIFHTALAAAWQGERRGRCFFYTDRCPVNRKGGPNRPPAPKTARAGGGLHRGDHRGAGITDIDDIHPIVRRLEGQLAQFLALVVIEGDELAGEDDLRPG